MIIIEPNIKFSHNSYEWKISNQCNKNCHYCIERKNTTLKKDYYDISEEELRNHERIFKFLNNTEIGKVELCGGEPTMHPKGIYYFNKLCKDSVNKKDKHIYLITHGDISPEKITELNPGEKDQHLVAISYHHYQVDFLDWIQKVIKIKERCNVMVSAIIPKHSKYWTDILTNLNIILNYGIDLQIKLELDQNNNNVVDTESYEYFKGIIKNSREKNKYFKGLSKYSSILRDTITNECFEIKNRKIVTIGIPILKNRTICQNYQYGIFDNIISSSCGVGKDMEITHNTTDKEIEESLRNNAKMFCTEERCVHDIFFNKITYCDDELHISGNIFEQYRTIMEIK